MTAPPPPAPPPKAGGLNDLSDDALGFGLLELRTARDVVLRPRVVLEAWMTQGPTGGGHYARPLRLYLALCAILMLVMFLQGGSAMMLGTMPPGMMDPLIAASGKSRDAFMADADGWMTLVMVPLMSLLYALAATPLLRWWDPERLGWRRGIRATFGYLCAVTVPVLPFSWWMYGQGGDLGLLVGNSAMFIAIIAAFMRMGAGRWYRSPFAGLAKAFGLSLTIMLAGTLGYVPVLLIGLLAGRFA